MKDYLVRIITDSGSVRGLACVTTNLVNEACRRHGTCPTASAALGRALSGGALLGALLKFGQRVALKFEGNGPLQKILVEAEDNGLVRGYVGVPEVNLPLKRGKLDVASAIGHAGFLTVTKDLKLKEPYKGTVQLYTSEIAEDLAMYLTESEQIPSAVGLGVFVEATGNISAAGGFLIQALPSPEESDEIINTLVERIESMPSMVELLRDGNTPEDLLERLFHDIPYRILEKHDLAFQCSCNKGRMEQALISLGKDDFSALIKERETVEVTCEFCRESYLFKREELNQFMEEIQ